MATAACSLEIWVETDGLQSWRFSEWDSLVTSKHGNWQLGIGFAIDIKNEMQDLV